MAIGLPPCMAKFSLGWTFTIRHLFCFRLQKGLKLDPVGPTVRHDIMRLCTGSVYDTLRRKQMVIDDTGSVKGTYAFIY